MRLPRITTAAVVLIVAAVYPRLCEAAPASARYYDDIKPLLAIHCYKCHGAEEAKHGLRLDLRERAFAGGKSSKPAIVPGDSGASEMVRRISSSDSNERMPPKGEPLSSAEIATVRRWIDEGAKWPDRDDYWAFQPPTAPPVPTVSSTQSSNSIDRFILARLEEEKIAPAPRADRRTLLRRAFADLLGVPPSPQEADTFLNDTSPRAFENLVDRLLADPRYGQRWARHWLDLARYSESDGFEDDKIRPHAWRYRDYVIRSLNQDKPYDRFVEEQIAGDELWPDDPDAWVATGFARLGMWDGMSKDPARQRQDFLNDATDTVGSVFLGLTVGCARCHDHKYDRITQRDYYSLQTFFANIARDEHELSGDVHDPPHVAEPYQKAHSELAKLPRERNAILGEAREQVEKEHRDETDEHGKALGKNEQVNKRAEQLHPNRLAELAKAVKDFGKIERINAPTADAIFERSADAPKTFVLKGGELSRPGDEVRPAVIDAIAPSGGAALPITPIGTSTGRRAALARWLVSPQNPLTARVMVNRLWQHHFGRGIVATPSDFGRHGQPPTHVELLDWLACRFVEDGWSLKRMHRLMMTSEAYQRADTFDPAAAAVDPQNKLLWRMNRRRLEAEAIRDSMLTVSGQISPVCGGPGVYPRISKEINVELPNNDKELSWGTCSDEEDRRASIYIFQRRSLTFPLVEVFDGAPMSQSCPVRPMTTVAPQALALFNGQFAREQAAHLADRVRREAGDDLDQQIRRVFLLALTRQPTEDELASAKEYLVKQAAVRRQSASPAAIDPASAAMTDFCHVILNTNEFIFID